MKKLQKKKYKNNNRTIRYFSEELTLSLTPQYVPRGPINGNPTVCQDGCAKTCILSK